VDHQGIAYLAGTVTGGACPRLTGPYAPSPAGRDRRQPGGGDDAFFARFSPSGESLLASGYLGGSGADIAKRRALLPDGRLASRV
jgi:hypothetical protein